MNNNIVSLLIAFSPRFWFGFIIIITIGLCGNGYSESSSTSVGAIQIEMGLLDHESKAWDGYISISDGDVLRLEAADFIGVNDNIAIHDNDSWAAKTSSWPKGTFPKSTQAEPNNCFQGMYVRPVRLICQYRADMSAKITIAFDRSAAISGQQVSFALADVPQQASFSLLGGQVLVHRLPVTEQITDSHYQNDYPAMTADKTGDLWVTWVGYHQNKDEVFMRQYHKGVWSAPIKITKKSGDIYGTACAVDDMGRVWVVWSQQQNTDRHLFACSYDGKRIGKIQQLTDGHGKNFFHRMISDKRGNLHLAWQGFRAGRSDIFVKSLAGNTWSKEIDLSDTAKNKHANDWCPAITTEPNGKVWVAWDTYDTGSYNIRLRSLENDRLGRMYRVTDTPRFHANASVAVDSNNRLWVAYEEAEENWGKDIGFLFKGGAPLYLTRKIRVVILDKDTWLQPRGDLNQIVPEGAKQFVQSPQLCPDSTGSMRIIFRPRTFAIFTPPGYNSNFAQWELLVGSYAGDQWTPCMNIPASAGRNEALFSMTTDGLGKVHTALVTDHRAYGQKPYNSGNNDIVVSSVETINKISNCVLVPRVPESSVQPQVEPDEAAQVAAVREYVVNCAGKNYRIYRGDLHRHSDISLDGIWEGSLVTVYRYLLDAASLDFGAVADHVLDWNDWEYWWWQNCKIADMFNLPGYFSPLFGYERSVAGPNGHRNIFFATRNVQPLVQTALEQEGKVSTGSILYPYLRQHKGICISHTSSSWNHGTDWRDGNDVLEPVAEIFQGCRSSSEHLGAPLTPSEGIPSVEIKGYRPDGWLWNAWAKGYKLGVIASSDHWSTHVSYAFILTDDFSREGLLQAMKQRHTYAATSNIIMDFRIRDSNGEHLMGDETCTTTKPELMVKVLGTAPIKEAVIIRDNKYIFNRKGSGVSLNFTYSDPNISPGAHYYYARMEQEDGNVSWSSPIWVEYKPKRMR